MIFLMTGSWLGLRSRSSVQIYKGSPDDPCPDCLNCSPSPFNLFEGDLFDHSFINYGEFIKHFVYPAGDFSGEPVIAFSGWEDIDEPPPLFVYSPFHPIKACAALFYVHMAVAFPRRMIWLIVYIGTQVTGNRVANASHYSDSTALNRENRLAGGTPLLM